MSRFLVLREIFCDDSPPRDDSPMFIQFLILSTSDRVRTFESEKVR